MKKIAIFTALLLMLYTGIFASQPYCTNLGFELGNFENWTGKTWVFRTNSQSYLNTSPVTGIINGRQTIVTDQSAYDIYTGYQLKKIPTGFRYSAMLGTTVTGGLHQSLSYSLNVDSLNALLIYHFAVVLQDPLNGHEKYEEPRFKVTLFDEEGDTIRDCANYDVYVSDARITGFNTSYVNNKTILWRDWTSVGINLLPYIGKTVTIEFMSADCTHDNHFGYAYFTAECHPLLITVDYCSNDTAAKLNAPSGFESYTWRNSKADSVGNLQYLVVNDPSEGESYSCDLVSATGCEVTLNSTIYRYEPNADFTNDRIDCDNLNNTLQFYITNPPTHGTLEYKWNFHDGIDSISYSQNPIHLFKSVSGWVPVTLVVTNPPSSCADSITKMIETFYPPLVAIQGDSTYCPNKTTVLKGYGADHYEWKLNGNFIGDKDSVEIGAPGGKLELTGYTSGEECYTTKTKTITEEPDWSFTATADTYFCKSDSVILIAEGADTYSWTNNSSTKSSLFVSKPGVYTVIGKNKRGCEKTISIKVDEIELPKADFSVMPQLIDSRHNEIQCYVPQEENVNYYWDYGDGDTESLKNSVTHKYTNLTIINDEKVINLKAVNSYGCENSSENIVMVGPFFPNVFTPNTDGINERFLTGIETQITDRYGIVIYKGNEGWNGKFNNTGNDLPADTYFYFASYIDFNGVTQTKKGYVTLIRARQ